MSNENQRPRVLVVGGPDVHLRLELMNLLRSDFDLSAMGSDPALAAKFDDAGFRYDNYFLARRVNPFVDLQGVFRMVSIFKRVRPHIVHTFATKPSVWGRLAAHVARVPVIIGTLPGLGTLYAEPNLAGRLFRLVYQPLQKWACHVSDLTIFQNKSDVLQFTSAGVVSESKSIIIPGSGVATDRFQRARVPESTREGLRSQLGFGADDIVVTMISRLTRSKGVLDLLHAARQTRAGYPKARFLLIGPEDKSVDRLSSSDLAQLKEVVTWLGPRKDIVDLLAISDIFAFPTAYREGVPRVLLEAGAMELPLVATDLPGCHDVVESGVNGLLVPPRNPEALARAIGKLIEQPELRQELGKASRERIVGRFDVALIANRTRSVYWSSLRDKKLFIAEEAAL